MPWTTRRRQELLELLDKFDPSCIDQLSQVIEQEAEQIPEVKRRMTHPGVGPITALAFVLIIGTPDRFGCGKQVASYLGLIPCEDSSADRWRLGHITQQGNALLRYFARSGGTKCGWLRGTVATTIRVPGDAAQ